MNSKLLSRFLVAAAFVFGLAAKEAKPAATPNKKPDLRIDATPVTEGKSPLVASYADVVEPVQKAVVSIYSSKTVKERVQLNPYFRQFPGLFPEQERSSKQEGLGSGVIVSADGYILTNNHVVEGADELKILLTDDREFTAKIIGTDPKTDIAVIKVDAENLPVVTLADSGKIRVGDVVFAIGNPLAIGQTVTMGIVSAKGRNVHILDEVQGYEDFIQTDAAINMGNSGGALVDAKGRLVGINSAIYSPTRTNIGIGFAIPVNLAASIMNSLIATGTVSRGYLGVGTDPLTADVAEQLGLAKDAKGVVVINVAAGSPAEKSGLKLTDVILGINDHPFTSLEDFRLTIAQLPPGSAAKLKIVRDGKEKLVDITLGTFQDKPDELFAGVSASPLTAEARKRLSLDPAVAGLLITAVAEDSPLRDRLAANMVIMEINRMPVTDLANAKQALALRPDRGFMLVYFRGGARIVPLPAK